MKKKIYLIDTLGVCQSKLCITATHEDSVQAHEWKYAYENEYTMYVRPKPECGVSLWNHLYEGASRLLGVCKNIQQECSN